MTALASAAPELLIAHTAAATRQIRLGSGGVLLQHYAPFKVAEQFAVLSALAPGRIDLGIGKAPGGLPATTRALQAETAAGKAAEFGRKLAELDSLLRGTVRADDPLHGARLSPPPRALPELFLLGGSAGSATMAARLGWEFVHAGHQDGDAEATERSLSSFEALRGRRPLLAVAAFAAETRAEAERQVQRLTGLKLAFADGHAVNLGTEDGVRDYVRQYQAWKGELAYTVTEKRPNVLLGTADDVHAALERLQEAFGVSEFVIDVPVADRAARLRCIELLACDRARGRERGRARGAARDRARIAA